MAGDIPRLPQVGLLLDIGTGVIFTFLCVQGSDSLPHALMWGIFLASVAGALSGHTLGTSRSWDWFRWVKRCSLAFGWVAIFVAWWLLKRKDTYPRAALCARRVVQGAVMVNVLEAAILMLLAGNYAGGAVCALLSLVSPDWSFVDSGGRMSCQEQVSFFGRPIPMSSRWYFRIYYIVLSFCLCFGKLFKWCWMYVYMSCMFPLFYQEVLDPRENVGVVFKVRVFMIVSVSFVDSFIDTHALPRSTPFEHPQVQGAQLHFWNAAILVTSGLLFCAVDLMRPPAEQEAAPGTTTRRTSSGVPTDVLCPSGARSDECAWQASDAGPVALP